MRKEVVWPAALAAAALALRAWDLGQASLYVDEGVSVIYASRPLREIFPFMIQTGEVHPPLYFYLLHLWMGLGMSEAVLRMSSVLFGAANVWLTYLLCRDLLGEKCARLAAALMCLSFFHIFYCRELRMYPMVTAFFLGAVLCWLKAVRSSSRALRARWLIAYGACCAAACYTHYLALFLVGSLLLFSLLSLRRSGEGIALWVKGALAGLGPFAPFVAIILGQSAAQDFSMREVPTLKSLAELMASMAFGNLWSGWPVPVPLALAAIVPLALIVYGIRMGMRGKEREGVLLVTTYLLVPSLAIILLSTFTRVRIYESKYFYVVMPAFFSLLAYALVQIRAAQLRIWLAVALLLPNILCIAAFLHDPNRYVQDWRWASRVVMSVCRRGVPIIVHPSMMAAPFYYYASDRFEDIAPADEPDGRIEKIERAGGPLVLVTTPNHPYVARAGLYRYLTQRRREEGFVEHPSFFPSGVIRVVLYAPARAR
jgi:4-amino-4-deoxy-L-arabinose transferase-like glycosyltransferase